MCNRKTASCHFYPHLVSNGKFPNLIINWVFCNFGLFDAIIVILKEFLVVWNVMIYGVETSDGRLFKVFTLAQKTRLLKK